MPNRNLVTLALESVLFTEKTVDGKKYFIAPVVALVEGVHNDVLYTAEELAKFPMAWNGQPVTLDHPEKNGEKVSANSPDLVEKWEVGRLYNFSFDPLTTKLAGEVWIEVAKISKLAPQVLQLIKNGGKLEVSTGLFVEEEMATGVWNDEEYQSIAHNMRPDHLALLPGSEGACNWKDGCGIRTNTEEGDSGVKENEDKEKVNWMRKLFQQVSSAPARILSQLTNELSHDDLRTELRDAIRAAETNGSGIWIREVYDGYFIYEKVEIVNGIETGPVKLYKRTYSIDNNETAVINDDAQEVMEETQYIEITNNDKAIKTEVKQMSNEARIAALIACNKTRFKEDDREWLSTLSECQLDKLKALDVEPEGEPVPEPEAVEPETPEVPEETAPEPEVEAKPKTPEEYIDAAPEEMKETLSRALARDRAIKSDAVEKLMANKHNKFTKEELAAKSLKELENLAELARVDVDFSGRSGGPATNAAPDVNVVPLVWDSEKK